MCCLPLLLASRPTLYLSLVTKGYSLLYYYMLPCLYMSLVMLLPVFGRSFLLFSIFRNCIYPLKLSSNITSLVTLGIIHQLESIVHSVLIQAFSLHFIMNSQSQSQLCVSVAIRRLKNGGKSVLIIFISSNLQQPPAGFVAPCIIFFSAPHSHLSNYNLSKKHNCYAKSIKTSLLTSHFHQTATNKCSPYEYSGITSKTSALSLINSKYLN